MRLVRVVTSTRSLRFDALAGFVDQIVDLAFQRFDRDLRIDQAGRAHDLFDHAALRPLHFRSAQAWR